MVASAARLPLAVLVLLDLHPHLAWGRHTVSLFIYLHIYLSVLTGVSV